MRNATTSFIIKISYRTAVWYAKKKKKKDNKKNAEMDLRNVF